MSLVRDNVWTPVEKTTRHTGSPIPSNLVFFVEPSPDIGELWSADSDLTDPPQPTKFGQTVALTVGIFGSFSVLLYFVFESIWPALLSLGFAAFCIWGAFNDLEYTCSFVGRSGVQQGTVPKIKKSGKIKASMLAFTDASSLYARQTHRYKNGVYTGSTYKYEWKMPANGRYVLSGSYQSKEGRPEEGHPFYFAVAAENAWTQHLLPLALEDVETTGHVSFPMSGKFQMIRISKGALEFSLKGGDTQKLLVEDIENAVLSRGRFYFKHKDPSWWSGKGKCDFCYQDIPNAKLFLVCLTRIAGVRLS